MQQTPHPSARLGVPPGVLNSSPPILNYLPKTFTMEKVLHPDCTCGQPVAYEIEQSPVFEDDGQIAVEFGAVYFHTMCEECLYKAYQSYEEYKPQRDELPF